MIRPISCRVVSPFLWLAIIVLFTAAFPVVLYAEIEAGVTKSTGFLLMVWVLAITWGWIYYGYLVAYAVDVDASGRLTFRYLTRRLTIPASDLVSMRKVSSVGRNRFLVEFRSAERRAFMVRPGSNCFHDLAIELKILSPALDVRGISYRP
jgi:hypothetical protein